MQIVILKQLQICVLCVRTGLFSLYLDHARGFFALKYFRLEDGRPQYVYPKVFYPYIWMHCSHTLVRTCTLFLISVLELIVSLFLIFLQIDSHIKRLDEDLTSFADDLKQGSENSSKCQIQSLSCN